MLYMPADGPAVEGANVTLRKHRAESWCSSQKAVTLKTMTERSERHGVQGRYGAILLVILKEIFWSRSNFIRSSEVYVLCQLRTLNWL